MKKLLLLGLGAYALYYLTQTPAQQTPPPPPPSPPNPPVRTPSGADLNLEVTDVQAGDPGINEDAPLM